MDPVVSYIRKLCSNRVLLLCSVLSLTLVAFKALWGLFPSVCGLTGGLEELLLLSSGFIGLGGTALDGE